jgi:hypothetical protein
MLGGSALELIAEFDGTKRLRPDVQKPVWHNSLRLPDGETLSNDQWINAADDYMKMMGFSDTISVAMSHMTTKASIYTLLPVESTQLNRHG